MTKGIIIFGTTHQQQEVNNTPSIFEKKIRNYILRDNVSIIMEEWKFGDTQTLGKQIADSMSIAWCNAGTPNQEEFRTDNPCPIWLDGSCMTESSYGPIEVQIKREAYMIDKIQQAIAEHQVGLFVCGMAHLHSISEKLHLAGYEVSGSSCLS